jgi:glucosylceramidase
MHEILVASTYSQRDPDKEKLQVRLLFYDLARSLPQHFRRPRTLRQLTGLGLLSPIWLYLLFQNGAQRLSGSAKSLSNAAAVEVVVTTPDRTLLLERQPQVSFSAGADSSGLVIQVDETKQYQEMDGFGGSLTDSSVWLIANKLTASQRATLIEQLFSPTNGIGISFLRQPMGATDFSASGNYSYDDMPLGRNDPSLRNFSIAHDNAYTIPLVKEALVVNPAMKIVALPWSPPAWMKVSQTMNGGTMDPSYFPSLAQYFVRFVKAYQEKGVPIYAVSVQNEPLYSTEGYPSEYLAADDESTFIAIHLRPALNRAGLSRVKILAYEHNWDEPSYPESVLRSAAAHDVAGTSFHCYKGDPDAQSAVKAAFPQKDIWFTECSGITSTSFAGDLLWNAEHLLIGATRNWARSVSLWNLALDQNSGPRNGTCRNCRGVVTIDDSVSPAKVIFNVEYYVLGHLGRFCFPGAHRIESNTFGTGNIEDVAFKNPDGSIALVVLNSASENRTFAVNSRGRSFHYTLPGGAVATFIWK